MVAQVAVLSFPPTAMPVPSDQVMVCLLGGFRLLRAGQHLDASLAGKAVTLLSALALHLETGVPRDTLLELLWPERDWDRSADSLHSLIYGVHRRLRAVWPNAAPIVYANGAYALNTAAGVSTDIASFDALMHEGDRLAAAQHTTSAASCYARAVDLYRGDLVTGVDVFAVIERERLRASFLTMLAWFADRAFRDADYPAALAHAAKLLAYDPCREDAHRALMRAHVRRGERAQALRQYRVCVDVLRREFDAEPEAATTALFDQIRSNVSGI